MHLTCGRNLFYYEFRILWVLSKITVEQWLYYKHYVISEAGWFQSLGLHWQHGGGSNCRLCTSIWKPQICHSQGRSKVDLNKCWQCPCVLVFDFNFFVLKNTRHNMLRSYDSSWLTEFRLSLAMQAIFFLLHAKVWYFCSS